MDPIQLKSIANHPVPQGADVGIVATRDKIRLRYAIWAPTDARSKIDGPKGTVCLFQGRTEFIEKYFEVIEDLRGRGFTVATMDWRGQGLSDRLLKDRLKGHVRSFRHYHRDLDAFLALIASKNCPKPYFALAHSMGGHILFSAAADGPATAFERIVLTAPMMHLAADRLPGLHRISKVFMKDRIASQRTARLLTGLGRFLGLGGAYVPGRGDQYIFEFDDNLITSDEARYATMNAYLRDHPDLALAAPTFAWVNSACRSMRRCLTDAYLGSINVPMLIVASGQDQVVSTPVIERVGPMLRVGSHLVIRSAQHEIMFERYELRDQFWAAFDAFIPGTDDL
ncbi:MAG: alpha/beta hydrolase [Pseudomonadota bacterium]